jgi:hypothetical protein
MRTIRASEIGVYLYCHRSWWYYKNGETSINQAELADGMQLHQRHGASLLASSCLQYLAYGLILLSLILLVVYLTLQFL